MGNADGSAPELAMTEVERDGNAAWSDQVGGLYGPGNPSSLCLFA